MKRWLVLMHAAPLFCVQWWLWELGLAQVTPMSEMTRAGCGFLLAAMSTVGATMFAAERGWLGTKEKP